MRAVCQIGVTFRTMGNSIYRLPTQSPKLSTYNVTTMKSLPFAFNHKFATSFTTPTGPLSYQEAKDSITFVTLHGISKKESGNFTFISLALCKTLNRYFQGIPRLFQLEIFCVDKLKTLATLVVPPIASIMFECFILWM